MAKITLDNIFNQSKKIEAPQYCGAFFDAISSKITTIEIIHGKGSGQLKKGIPQYCETFS